MSRLLGRFKSIGFSASYRAVAALMSGNAVAMAVPILAAPILGRLYNPADYAALALYMAPAAVLAAVSSLQLQHAIIKEKSDRSADLAVWLCVLTAFITSGLTALTLAVLWVPFFNQSLVGAWLIFMPLTVAGSGFVTSCTFLANRHRRYRSIASVQVIFGIVTVILSILFGYLSLGADGLLAAYLLGQAVQISCSIFILLRLLDLSKLSKASHLMVILRRHWRFPAFTLPSEFSNQITLQLPVFALTALSADALLGAFNRARNLVSMPTTVLGLAVAQVFRRQASERYMATGSCRKLMLSTLGSLLAAGIGPCLLFMILGPWLFVVYLGPAWREAGEVARILAPMFLLKIIVTPLNTVFYFTGNQALELKLVIVALVIMAFFMATFSWALDGNALGVIWAFSAAYFVIYTMYIVAAFRVAGP